MTQGTNEMIRKSAHGSGTTDYARIVRFGVPAKREVDAVNTADRFAKWDTAKRRHARDRARQQSETDIDFDVVALLLRKGYNLTKAKELARDSKQ